MTLENQQFQCEAKTIEALRSSIPRRCVADYPTPLVYAERLTKRLGVDQLWFKRDDLISFGLGGNKVRGLEVILADALCKGADTLVTGAGVLSNHVRTTAAIASVFGLSFDAVYWGQPPPKALGNHRITKMLGANIHFTLDNDRSSVDDWINKVTRELLNNGNSPYPIPRGGACVLGVLGHVLAVCELYEQCKRLKIKPDRIILAVGSGGMYAGWLLGVRLLNLPWQVMGFSVSRQASDIKLQATTLAGQAAETLGLDISFRPTDLCISDNYIGEGYGIPSAEGNEAVRLVCQTEGVLLDPVYTGKAMAGFIDEIHNTGHSSGTSVFIHSGGEPSYYAT
jgi:D-cysteine desulfhydrase family pyridoxal phosphate-dependent enzyme